MYSSMLWDRFSELTAQEFTWALETRFRDLRPDPNFPALTFLDARIPLDMFDVSKDFLAHLVLVSIPLALRISVTATTERLSAERHDDVCSIVLLFRSAILEMFAEIDNPELGALSLYDFADSLLKRADRIHKHSVKLEGMHRAHHRRIVGPTSE